MIFFGKLLYFNVESTKQAFIEQLSNITVLNTPGTIDSDYRGELKIILFNHSKKEFIINNKDRIAQMVILPILKFDFEETDKLQDTIRGSGGFGSTGN